MTAAIETRRAEHTVTSRSPGARGRRRRETLTLPLDLRGLAGRLLPRGRLVPGVQDHILGLQAVQLVGEALARRLKLYLLQEHLLGGGGQQLVEVRLVAGVLAAGLQSLLEFVDYRHGWGITTRKDMKNNNNNNQ